MKYLTYTNYGCIDLCKNMIKSLVVNGGVSPKDIHIHCFDAKSFEELKEYQPYFWIKMPENLQDYKNWSFDPSSEFCSIVSWKWKIIRKFYEANPEFVFTDSDIFFKTNVESDLRSYNKNICIQCDYPGSKYCTGFMYFNGSSEATSLINYCANNHMDDQIIMNKYAEEPINSDKIHLLDIGKYPNGHHYYRSDFDRSNSMIIHNNHMVGKEEKMRRFKIEGNWL